MTGGGPPEGRVRRVEDLEVRIYHVPTEPTMETPYGVTIEGRGNGAWAICNLGSVMNGSREWEYEPSPSNRSDEFIARTRFASPQEALDFWNGAS